LVKVVRVIGGILPNLAFLGLLFSIFILVLVDLDGYSDILYKGLKAFCLINLIFNFIFKSFIVDFNKYIIILFKSGCNLLKCNRVGGSRLKLSEFIDISNCLPFFINYSKYIFKYNLKIILF
jgi:hypothetical protein